MQKTTIASVFGGGGANSSEVRRENSPKSGFTLAETLITLLIIGILAAVLLPVVYKAQPDKIEAMRRKCYYILENTVAQMYTDDSMYRSMNDGSSLGFRNIEPVKLNGITYSGKTKFCELYANALTKRTNSTRCISNEKTFTSVDNVDWFLPVTDFSEGYGEVKFDVNGKAEPNCEYDTKKCPKPDIFKYYVLSNGKIVETKPNLSGFKYCIKTNIKGSGSVSPSNDYCGLSNGIYTIKAVPSAGWHSNWPNNEKTVKIKDKDETLSVLFSESNKACINLNVNCDSGAPNNCGSYSISGSAFTQSGNILSACNLTPGNYTVTVTPLSNYSSSWQTETININGVDKNLSVDMIPDTHCAILETNCPEPMSTQCAEYTITGNGNTYGMSADLKSAKICSLKNGSYNLAISPKKRFIAEKTSIDFTISNSDWKGVLDFSRAPRCSAKGYFEVNGKRYSCPFQSERITTAECNDLKAKGIKYCGYEFNTVADDYWAGAVKACGGVNKLPSAQELADIAAFMLIKHPVIGPYEEIYESLGIGIDTDYAYMLELPGGYVSFTFWSNEELTDSYYGGHYAYVRRISLSGSTNWERYIRNGVGPNTICKLN